MKISIILNVALAIALVFLCYKLAVKGDAKGDVMANEQDSSEVVINNILKRTSVRSYEDRAARKREGGKTASCRNGSPNTTRTPS